MLFQVTECPDDVLWDWRRNGEMITLRMVTILIGGVGHSDISAIGRLVRVTALNDLWNDQRSRWWDSNCDLGFPGTFCVLQQYGLPLISYRRRDLSGLPAPWRWFRCRFWRHTGKIPRAWCPIPGWWSGPSPRRRKRRPPGRTQLRAT